MCINRLLRFRKRVEILKHLRHEVPRLVVAALRAFVLRKVALQGRIRYLLFKDISFVHKQDHARVVERRLHEDGSKQCLAFFHPIL